MELIPPLVAAVLLVGVMIRKDKYALVLPLSLIVGAGLSNYIDLLVFGYVRDPLAIGSFIFNIADVCIVIGTIWAIWVYTRR